jgi:hypothetical protein
MDLGRDNLPVGRAPTRNSMNILRRKMGNSAHPAKPPASQDYPAAGAHGRVRGKPSATVAKRLISQTISH